MFIGAKSNLTTKKRFYFVFFGFMTEMEGEDPLEALLAAVTELPDDPPGRSGGLRECDLFDVKEATLKGSAPSVVHTGDTDSSDDEGNRNYEDQKYNECGRNLKHLLTANQLSSSSLKPLSVLKPPVPQVKPTYQDVTIDPIFRMRIINPKVSMTLLSERMQDRLPISFSDLPTKIMAGTLKDKDWVLCGVVVNKSPPKVSQKGSQYSIWTLTDLKDDIKTVGLFMFSSAHSDLWKTQTGSVVGILNPTILERKDGSKDVATLSVSTAQAVMILGESKDFGLCKSIKKNGDKCTSIVNLSKCEYCVYHIKQEYQKCSKRSELQANFAGKGLVGLRNKVLGKNEVFYAGKSYTAIPAKKSHKLEAKDNNIMERLNVAGCSPKLKVTKEPKKGMARHLEVDHAQRVKDLELLKKLGGSTTFDGTSDFSGCRSQEVGIAESRATALDVIKKLKTQNENNKPIDKDVSLEHISQKTIVKKPESALDKMCMGFPTLSTTSDLIDLNQPITPKQIDRAKVNAIKYIQRHGPIKKVDPNSTKSKKRPLEPTKNDPDPIAKKSKLQDSDLISDRFKKMMAMTSINSHLLEEHDNLEKEKYFGKLEAKERMEDKMANTHKVKCKAVKCLQCKYVSFSASDFCKTEKHPLKVFDAMKRFYKCANCQNRTVTLDLVPLKPCTNCGSGKWEKTGMMREKVALVQHNLSIRGGEQKFVNSHVTDASLDLLVPDDQ